MLPYHTVSRYRSSLTRIMYHETRNKDFILCRMIRVTCFVKWRTIVRHCIHAFGSKLSPYTFSAHFAFRPKTVRVVSCYALFKGWLLLSQPPTCLRQNTSLSLSLHLGTLSGDLGSFPRVHEALPSRTHCHTLHRGIRSLFGKPTRKGTANHSVLYPLYYYMTLRLNAFRGEPAITRLDKLFTSTHSSSPSVARLVSTDLLSPFLADSS